MGRMKAQVFEGEDAEYVIYRSQVIGLVKMRAVDYADWWRMHPNDRDRYPMVSRGHTREEAQQLIALSKENTDE